MGTNAKIGRFFSAPRIVVHPARTHDETTFFENIEKLNDKRIFIENMAGQDIDAQDMQYGQTLKDLITINKKLPICFDFEKSD